MLKYNISLVGSTEICEEVNKSTGVMEICKPISDNISVNKSPGATETCRPISDMLKDFVSTSTDVNKNNLSTCTSNSEDKNILKLKAVDSLRQVSCDVIKSTDFVENLITPHEYENEVRQTANDDIDFNKTPRQTNAHFTEVGAPTKDVAVQKFVNSGSEIAPPTAISVDIKLPNKQLVSVQQPESFVMATGLPLPVEHVMDNSANLAESSNNLYCISTKIQPSIVETPKVDKTLTDEKHIKYLVKSLLKKKRKKYKHLRRSEPLPVWTVTEKPKHRTGESVDDELDSHEVTNTHITVAKANIQNIPIQRSTVQDIPVAMDAMDNIQDIPVAKANIQDIPVAKANIQDIPVAKANIQDIPVAKANIQDIPVAKANIQDIPVAKANIQDIPVAKANIQDIPVAKANIQDIPVAKANIQDIPVVKANIQDIPVAKDNIQDIPVAEANIQDIPTEKSLVQQTILEKSLEGEICEEKTNIIPAIFNNTDESSGISVTSSSQPNVDKINENANYEMKNLLLSKSLDGEKIDEEGSLPTENEGKEPSELVGSIKNIELRGGADFKICMESTSAYETREKKHVEEKEVLSTMLSNNVDLTCKSSKVTHHNVETNIMVVDKPIHDISILTADMEEEDIDSDTVVDDDNLKHLVTRNNDIDSIVGNNKNKKDLSSIAVCCTDSGVIKQSNEIENLLFSRTLRVQHSGTIKPVNTLLVTDLPSQDDVKEQWRKSDVNQEIEGTGLNNETGSVVGAVNVCTDVKTISSQHGEVFTCENENSIILDEGVGVAKDKTDLNKMDDVKYLNLNTEALVSNKNDYLRNSKEDGVDRFGKVGGVVHAGKSEDKYLLENAYLGENDIIDDDMGVKQIVKMISAEVTDKTNKNDISDTLSKDDNVISYVVEKLDKGLAEPDNDVKQDNKDITELGDISTTCGMEILKMEDLKDNPAERELYNFSNDSASNVKKSERVNMLNEILQTDVTNERETVTNNKRLAVPKKLKNRSKKIRQTVQFKEVVDKSDSAKNFETNKKVGSSKGEDGKQLNKKERKYGKNGRIVPNLIPKKKKYSLRSSSGEEDTTEQSSNNKNSRQYDAQVEPIPSSSTEAHESHESCESPEGTNVTTEQTTIVPKVEFLGVLKLSSNDDKISDVDKRFSKRIKQGNLDWKFGERNLPAVREEKKEGSHVGSHIEIDDGCPPSIFTDISLNILEDSFEYKDVDTSKTTDTDNKIISIVNKDLVKTEEEILKIESDVSLKMEDPEHVLPTVVSTKDNDGSIGNFDEDTNMECENHQTTNFPVKTTIKANVFGFICDAEVEVIEVEISMENTLKTENIEVEYGEEEKEKQIEVTEEKPDVSNIILLNDNDMKNELIEDNSCADILAKMAGQSAGQKSFEDNSCTDPVENNVQNADQKSFEDNSCTGPVENNVQNADQKSFEDNSCTDPVENNVQNADQKSFEDNSCTDPVENNVQNADQKSFEDNSCTDPVENNVQNADQKSFEDNSCTDPVENNVQNADQKSFGDNSCTDLVEITVQNADQKSFEDNSCTDLVEITVQNVDKKFLEDNSCTDLAENNVQNADHKSLIPKGPPSLTPQNAEIGNTELCFVDNYFFNEVKEVDNTLYQQEDVSKVLEKSSDISKDQKVVFPEFVGSFDISSLKEINLEEYRKDSSIDTDIKDKSTTDFELKINEILPTATYETTESFEKPSKERQNKSSNLNDEFDVNRVPVVMENKLLESIEDNKSKICLADANDASTVISSNTPLTEEVESHGVEADTHPTIVSIVNVDKIVKSSVNKAVENIYDIKDDVSSDGISGIASMHSDEDINVSPTCYDEIKDKSKESITYDGTSKVDNTKMFSDSFESSEMDLPYSEGKEESKSINLLKQRSIPKNVEQGIHKVAHWLDVEATITCRNEKPQEVSRKSTAESLFNLGGVACDNSKITESNKIEHFKSPVVDDNRKVNKRQVFPNKDEYLQRQALQKKDESKREHEETTQNSIPISESKQEVKVGSKPTVNVSRRFKYGNLSATAFNKRTVKLEKPKLGPKISAKLSGIKVSETCTSEPNKPLDADILALMSFNTENIKSVDTNTEVEHLSGINSVTPGPTENVNQLFQIPNASCANQGNTDEKNKENFIDFKIEASDYIPDEMELSVSLQSEPVITYDSHGVDKANVDDNWKKEVLCPRQRHPSNMFADNVSDNFIYNPLFSYEIVYTSHLHCFHCL